jgi:hypothetical protein
MVGSEDVVPHLPLPPAAAAVALLLLFCDHLSTQSVDDAASATRLEPTSHDGSTSSEGGANGSVTKTEEEHHPRDDAVSEDSEADSNADIASSGSTRATME